MTRLYVFVLALAVAACGSGKVTSPDDGPPDRLESALGYHIERADYTGPIVQAHADLADRWWGELMRALQTAGFPADKADPTNIHGSVKIKLFEPRDSDHCFPVSGTMVCGAYWPYELLVPGTYAMQSMLGRRPAAQPLKHEMTHHWCIVVLGRNCVNGAEDQRDSHVWLTPNGQNIWDLQWY